MPLSPSSIHWCRCKIRGINRHTTRCTSLVSVVSQYKLVSSRGLWNALVAHLAQEGFYFYTEMVQVTLLRRTLASSVWLVTISKTLFQQNLPVFLYTDINCNSDWLSFIILFVIPNLIELNCGIVLSALSLVWLVTWSSGRASVFGRCAFAVLCSTCSWWVTTYVGKLSAIGQPTRPTQPFILSGSINE